MSKNRPFEVDKTQTPEDRETPFYALLAVSLASLIVMTLVVGIVTHL